MDMLKRGLALIFKRRDFGLLMGAQFAAQAGDGIVQAALAKLIVFGGQKGFDLEDARSPDELLRIALYIFVPYTIVSPFLGVVIDRWDRRRLLALANGLRAVVVLLVAIAGSTDIGDVPLFLAFLLTLASTRVVLATKSAAVPETVEPDELVEANAVSQLGGALFQLGGVGAATIAAEVVSVDAIVTVGALVYGAGAVCATFLRKVGEPREDDLTMGQEVARVVSNIVAGVREVSRTPAAAAAITTYFWLRVLWSFTIVGIGFEARELLADDDLQVIIITGGAGALGAGLGFLFARKLSRLISPTALLVLSASAIAGGATALLGPLTMKPALALLAFCLGLGFFIGKISLDVMVQESLGDDFRGRAFSLYDIAYNLAWVVAAGAMKIAWDADRQGILISAMGFVFLAGLALIGLWYRRAGLLSGSVEAEVR